MKRALVKLHWILTAQFGLDPIKFLQALRGAPRFVLDFMAFRRTFSGRISFAPCLHDRFDEGGSTKSEYFWQDLFVARRINEAAPKKHVDVGSRIDGFVAHVASFREIEVFDVRPVTTAVPGVSFKQADLMDERAIESLVSEGGYCDSLSCLHALEHFGLGRYGDAIEPIGWRKGLRNLGSLLKKNGTLYLAVPLGKERVEFNANWIFDPRTIVEAAASEQLILTEFHVFTPKEGLRTHQATDEALTTFAGVPYALGIFIFTKDRVC